MNGRIRTEWPGVLAGLIAMTYVWVGVAVEGWDRVWAVAGGLVILAALVAARRSSVLAVVLLVVGAVPLAASTWWSIVTPVLAITALTLGLLATLSLRRSRRELAASR